MSHGLHGLDKREKRLKRKVFDCMKKQGLIDLWVEQGKYLLPELETFGNDNIPDEKIEKAIIKAIPRLLKLGVIIPDDQMLLNFNPFNPPNLRLERKS